MRRYVLLFLVTVFLVLFVMIGIRLNWGRGTILPKPKNRKVEGVAKCDGEVFYCAC